MPRSSHSARARRSTALLAALVVCSGCATPIGVREIDRRTVGQVLTENTVSANRPSTASRQVMLRLSLADRFEREPEAALAELHELTLQEFVGDRLFALAEYSYLHAGKLQHVCSESTRNPRDRRPKPAAQTTPRPECERARAYYMASAIYAYAFLFPESARSAPNGFDPRLRAAADLYNLAVTSAIESNLGKITPGVRSRSFHLGTLQVELAAEELRYADRQLEDFVPAAQLAVRGLRNRYRRPGIGAPFVASAVAEEGARASIRSARVPKRVKVPVTVLGGSGREPGCAAARCARIEIYSEPGLRGRVRAGAFLSTASSRVRPRALPLWGFDSRALKSPPRRSTLSSDDGLIKSLQAGRIPVVLVRHRIEPGLQGRMFSELLSDPILQSMPVLVLHLQGWQPDPLLRRPAARRARRHRLQLDRK
jgi:hypothetical protein